MSLKVKRFIVVAMTACLLSQVTQGAWAAGEASVFEGAGAYVLRSTEAGSSLLSRLTGSTAEKVTESSFRSFMERLRWERSQPLKTEIQSELTRIRTALEEFRTTKNRPAKLAEGEVLIAEDR